METDGISRDRLTVEEKRLFLQDLCAFLCRYHHMEGDSARWQDVRIDCDYNLGVPGYSADLRVLAPSGDSYFLEIMYGQSNERIMKELGKKYGADTSRLQDARGVILVVDTAERWEWTQTRERLPSLLKAGLKLQVWDEERLLGMTRNQFGVEASAFDACGVQKIRNAIEDASGKYAFGEGWAFTSTQLELMWRFSPWRLRELREKRAGAGAAVVEPGPYERAVVLVSDLCNFREYSRNTADSATLREYLAAYYSKARNVILDAGGMVFDFRAERVTALFGIPEDASESLRAALECAQRLFDVGEAVCYEWQMRIDRIQSSQGVSVAITLGRVQLIAADAFDRSHFGAVTDEFAIADRLVAQARAGEVVVSNSFHQALDEMMQSDFAELDPVEAKDLGKIQLWKKIS